MEDRTPINKKPAVNKPATPSSTKKSLHFSLLIRQLFLNLLCDYNDKFGVLCACLLSFPQTPRRRKMPWTSLPKLQEWNEAAVVPGSLPSRLCPAESMPSFSHLFSQSKHFKTLCLSAPVLPLMPCWSTPRTVSWPVCALLPRPSLSRSPSW